MSSQILQEIEGKIDTLSVAEKRRLLDRLTQDVRRVTDAVFAGSLAEMAADPEIRKELQQIQHDFANTEEDGLERF